MSQDEYTKLFNYLQAEFKNMNARFDQITTKLELNRLAIELKTASVQAATDKLVPKTR